MFHLSRRQAIALTLLLIVGLTWAFARAAAAGPAGPEPAVWSARIAFMQANQAALIAAPGLSPADIRARFRQIAKDPKALWSAYRAQLAWTPAREAVIARYVDLPNTVAAGAVDEGPIDKRRKRTRHFRLWP